MRHRHGFSLLCKLPVLQMVRTSWQATGSVRAALTAAALASALAAAAPNSTSACSVHTHTVLARRGGCVNSVSKHTRLCP